MVKSNLAFEYLPTLPDRGSSRIHCAVGHLVLALHPPPHLAEDQGSVVPEEASTYYSMCSIRRIDMACACYDATCAHPVVTSLKVHRLRIGRTWIKGSLAVCEGEWKRSSPSSAHGTSEMREPPWEEGVFADPLGRKLVNYSSTERDQSHTCSVGPD